MKIAGLRKMTLLDYPEKVACTVFTFGCNFRCPFCHNAPLVVGQAQEELTEEKFFAFLEKRRGVMDGVAVTGGEPTLQADLPAFLKEIKDRGFGVKLDTNGSRPEIVADLFRKGLVDYVAMDVKNSEEKYALTCGCDVDMAKIKETIRLLIEQAPDYEFRTTVVKGFHEEEDFEKIGKMIKGAKRYFLQKFTDSGALIGTAMGACSEEETKRFALRAGLYVPTSIRG